MEIVGQRCQVERESAGEASASKGRGRLDLLMRTGSEEMSENKRSKESIKIYVMATLP